MKRKSWCARFGKHFGRVTSTVVFHTLGLEKCQFRFMLGIEPKSRRMYGIYLQRHYFTSAVWHLGGSSDPGNHSSFTGRHLTGKQVFPLEDIDLKLSYPGDQRFLFDQEKRRIK
ncbi:hypothetical protein CDAR_518891 [Caerostris darwini]|uniref:Uncharacterized protein n=1 Tax=Caerostris darwini TaxID=1538125 RepID=A0AAV4PSV6_9ARAC|nr:hypothetical protein CDAR_518891 [Caerostris darwini]